MAQIYGINSGQIIPQPDFTAQQNENGGWTASQSFQMLKGEVDNPSIQVKFPLGATLLSLDPNADQFFSFLRISRIQSVDTLEGGYSKITCEFSGFSSNTYTTDPNEPDPVPTYSKRGVLIEAPLDEHPKWKALAETDKFALGLLIKGDAVSSPDFTGVGTYNDEGIWAAWEDDSGVITLADDALSFAKIIAQGKTTYKQASYEYTHRWEAKTGITAAQMNALGKVATPSGNPPTPGNGRNWMLVGVNEEQHGAGQFRFTNELVYLLSDEDGFDSFLYT